LQLNTKNTDELFHQALTAHQNGDLMTAGQLYERIISLNINHFDALHLIGVVYFQLQNPAKSVQFIKQAIKLNPNINVVYNNLGLALQALGQFQESIQAFTKSIQLERNNPESFFNLGNSFASSENLFEALKSYDEAIRQNPTYAQAFNNRGNIKQELNLLEEALVDYELAIKFFPYYDEARTNRGNILQELALFEDALSSYNSAICINPDNAEAYWNKALLLLLLGDYNNGLKLYEWRWKRENSTTALRSFNAPLWLGEQNLQGKTILIHAEQGLGDSIQFCRYIKLVAELGATVILEDQKPLKGLLQKLEGVSEFVVCGDPLPHFDYHCPMLSLPLAFKSTLDNVPDPSPYLFAEHNKVAVWSKILGPKNKPRIGICWSSVSAFRYDRKRSLRLSEFVRSLPVGNFEFICLQKEIKAEDLATLRSRPDIVFLGKRINDFTDTAALIELCDSVISSCTSVPHLSAAMNKKTHLLLSFVPDWRWGLHTAHSPFYKSVTLHRQKILNTWQLSPIQC